MSSDTPNSLGEGRRNSLRHGIGNVIKAISATAGNVGNTLLNVAETPLNAFDNISRAARRVLTQAKNIPLSLMQEGKTVGETSRMVAGQTMLLPVNIAKETVSATAVNAVDVGWQKVLDVSEFSVNQYRRLMQFLRFRNNKKRKPFAFSSKTRGVIQDFDNNSRGLKRFDKWVKGVNLQGRKELPQGI